MRFLIKAQAGLNLFSAAATPLWAAHGIRKGSIHVPTFTGNLKRFDLGSTPAKAAAAGIAAVTTVYGTLNAISRIRTAQDAETLDKVQKGKLDAAEVKLHSKQFDVVMTRMNAGLSGAISLASGVFAARSLLDPALSPDQKAEKVMATGTAMVATGIMSVSKWRAAGAAQKRIDEGADRPQSHVERLDAERGQAARQGPARS